MEMKFCKDCGEERPLSEFSYRTVDGRSYLRTYCKKHESIRSARYNAEHPEQHRKAALKSLHLKKARSQKFDKAEQKGL